MTTATDIEREIGIAITEQANRAYSIGNRDAELYFRGSAISFFNPFSRGSVAFLCYELAWRDRANLDMMG